jgi:cytochrome c biogenesis protein CcmG/thiol:disulfide interchange protein DsbE
MKRIALLLGTLLLLSGCAKSVEPIAGEVVSCAEINTDTSIKVGVQLGCLDGGEGAYLQGLRGPMLINVWGSWCYECGIEMPYLRTFYAKAQGKVALVGVDVEEKNIEAGQKYVESHGITWPNFYDDDGRSRGFFGMGVPVTWFIAADGSVAYKKIGGFKNELEIIGLTAKYLDVSL